MKRNKVTDSRRVQKKDYRDTWQKTFRKISGPRVGADISLALVPVGAGYAISLIAPDAVSITSDIVFPYVLEWVIRKFTQILESGEVQLSEVLGKTIPDARYQSVAEFWCAIDRDGLDTGALIEISGLLSPYGPLIPAHPMSRPGYTMEGWNAVGDLGAENTEAYDSRDAFIYGDRVIRLSRPRFGMYYAGLYDAYFGIANVALPLYVDRSLVKQAKHELDGLWKNPMVAGRVVKLKGRLKRITNYYSQFTKQLPPEYCTLPSFGLEVFEIETSREPDGVTHVSASVSWEKRAAESIITNYFNIQDKRQFGVSEEALEKTRNKHKNSLLFNYDDIACLSPEWRYILPKYNEMLKPWLEGRKI
jgi:hypothetical protein